MRDAIHNLLARCSRRKILGWGFGSALLASAQIVHARKRKTRRQRKSYPLKPRQFYWIPNVAPTGPAVAVVNLYTQMVQVFRNGIAVGFSSSSTGKRGKRTPVGLFSVLQKRRHHRSSTYNNAPMPWMIRLTWSGIAFHGGRLPGYPASHGCIRLPHKFAAKFFSVLQHDNMTLIVNNNLSSGVSPITMLAPIDPMGQPLLVAEAIHSPHYWNADMERGIMVQGQATLNLLVSLSQQRLYVLHQGYLLGALELPELPQSIPDRGGALYAWQAVENNAHWLAQDAYAQANPQLITQLLAHNIAFTKRLQPLMAQDSLLLITHLPAVNDIHTDLLHNPETAV